ncbi:MAG: hypothetical protein LH629_01005 [Ignavibacteria bacterium]|nr:hypothetical protein [Ignavibacteria bacterium]
MQRIEIDKKFEVHLKENEKIVWSGRPKQGILMRDVDIIIIPMSLILFGFALIMDYAAFTYQVSFVFKSLGVLLSLSVIYIGVLRFFVNANHRKKLFYCITSKRILVLSGKKKFSTLPLRNIESLDKTTENDGSGFITFGTVNPVWPWLFGGFYFTAENIPGLELVPDADIVYQILIHELQTNVDPEILEKLKPGKEDLN